MRASLSCKDSPPTCIEYAQSDLLSLEMNLLAASPSEPQLGNLARMLVKAKQRRRLYPLKALPPTLRYCSCRLRAMRASLPSPTHHLSPLTCLEASHTLHGPLRLSSKVNPFPQTQQPTFKRLLEPPAPKKPLPKPNKPAERATLRRSSTTSTYPFLRAGYRRRSSHGISGSRLRQAGPSGIGRRPQEWIIRRLSWRPRFWIAMVSCLTVYELVTLSSDPIQNALGIRCRTRCATWHVG
jgi:hypothetical protein